MCADKSNIRIVYGIVGFFETVNFDRIKVLAVKKKKSRELTENLGLRRLIWTFGYTRVDDETI